MHEPVLYAHPFSSYSQKVFIAFYEKGQGFELRTLSPADPALAAEFRSLWPIEKFPVLQADGQVFLESSIIIEWLDWRIPGEQLIPSDPERALEVRMLDRICDNYVMAPMQTIVSDRLRPEDSRDPLGVARAHEMLDRSLAWLDQRMASREWAACDIFSLADCAAAPALFYADWVHPVAAYPAVQDYLNRLRMRASFRRCVEDARPARDLFPGGAPTHVP